MDPDVVCWCVLIALFELFGDAFGRNEIHGPTHIFRIDLEPVSRKIDICFQLTRCWFVESYDLEDERKRDATPSNRGPKMC